MATLLVELLTEELPPKVLKKLGTAFGKGIVAQLTANNLVSETSDFAIFATPRRLAVTIDNVYDKSPEEIVNQRLMPKHVGFSADGTPSDALIKKLKSIGLDASHAEKTETKTDGKLEFIFIRQNKEGITITEGLQKALDLSIANLPIPKVMTYQPKDSLESVSFVRPAHGLIAIHGDDVVHVRALGLDSGNRTLGHRFHSQGMITIKNAAEYEITMETEGHIIPSYEKRKSNIQNQLQNESNKLDLILHDDEALLDEVTALVESPKVYQAQFDKEFLSIPEECLILTMKTNQKYFPLFGPAGKLAEKFLLVSNMDLDDPSHIIEGNEKVVRPRLADAKFFYQGDMNTPLKELAEKLKNVVYHNKLGTQHDRVIRLGKLSKRIGEQMGADLGNVTRAAELCKADLLSGMVGEFPELQGTMGKYYGVAQGESEEVSTALEQHYRPRFANDLIPNGVVSISLALADKLEIVTGMFGLELAPTGEKDPYALRRHAIGISRILAESSIKLNLSLLVSLAVESFPRDLELKLNEIKIKNFIIDRFKGYLKEKGFSIDKIEAVLATDSDSLHLAIPRLVALSNFLQTDNAQALSNANKRIRNILKKNSSSKQCQISKDLFTTEEESTLHNKMQSLSPVVSQAIDEGRYSDALRNLASARGATDNFFENVMVMSDDPIERANRLALLSELFVLLNCVGDLSEISISTTS